MRGKTEIEKKKDGLKNNKYIRNAIKNKKQKLQDILNAKIHIIKQ